VVRVPRPTARFFFEGHRKKDNPYLESNPVTELNRRLKAIVAVSIKPVAAIDQMDYHPDTKCGFVKMNVVKSLCTNEVICEATKMIQTSATVITDRRRCYKGLQDICASHEEIIVKDKKEVSKIFLGYTLLLVMLKRKY
jgi:CRISPR/Cas system-associated protein Csm6